MSIKRFFCLHKWPKVTFGMDEYAKTISCHKCGKTKTVYLVIGNNDKSDKRVMPTDYYQGKVV